MQEVYKFSIGIILLVLGIPIGNMLAHMTKEELKQGKKWFKLLIILSLIGGIIGAVIKNDAVMFSFFFISIVTSRSLKR